MVEHCSPGLPWGSMREEHPYHSLVAPHFWEACRAGGYHHQIIALVGLEEEHLQHQVHSEMLFPHRLGKFLEGYKNTLAGLSRIVLITGHLSKNDGLHLHLSVVKAWVGLTAAKIARAVRVCTRYRMLCNCGLLNTARLMFTFA